MKNIFLKKQILLLWVFASNCHMTLANELHAPLPKHEKRVKKTKKKPSGAKKAFVGVGTLAAAVGFAYWCSQQRGTPSADIPECSRPSSSITPIPGTSSPMQIGALAAEEKVYDVKNAKYHVHACLGLSIIQPDRSLPVYLVSVLKTTEGYKNARKNDDLHKWISVDKQVFQSNTLQNTITWQPELKYDDYKLMIYANTGDEYRSFIAEHEGKTPLDILRECESKIQALEQKIKEDEEQYANTPEYKQNTFIAPVRATLSQTQLLLYDSKSRRGWVGEMFAIHNNGNTPDNGNTPEITEFTLQSLPDQKGIVDGQTRIIVPLSFHENPITVFGTIAQETTTYRIIDISHKYQLRSYFKDFLDSPAAPKFRALSACHLGKSIPEC